jgi:hypothetical protein
MRILRHGAFPANSALTNTRTIIPGRVAGDLKLEIHSSPALPPEEKAAAWRAAHCPSLALLAFG